MAKDYIGAIDQGTTSTRFILFDRNGRIAAIARKEHTQIFPRPGWVEHDPREIWRNTVAVIEEALERCNLTGADVAAVGLTNQRETSVLWERRTGKPLHNAIVWQDMRVETLVRDYAGEGGADRFRRATGLPLATYFSALKLRWLLDNLPGARQAAEQGEALFGTIDCFLAWHLTGGPAGGRHITDVTNASRTQLMNLGELRWDPALLAAFSIPRACLPEIRSSSEIYGEISGIPGGALGGVPLAGILGDQQAALVGQACFAAGSAKNTYGTGCFLLMNTGPEIIPSRSGLITTVAYKFGGEPAAYAIEGSIAVTGALVRWLRDNLGIIRSSAEVEALAATVPDNGDVYIVPAFAGLFAPYWRADARGIICGLTEFANKGHLARAALEATAFQTAEIREAMEKDSGIAITELRCDGGMVGNDLLMQFQADILDIPVVRPMVTETTALGAAYAAGLAVRFWAGTAELMENWTAGRHWHPAMMQDERERLRSGWRKAVSRSFDWAK